MPNSIRPGDVLADRYRLVDLLTESGAGRFWRAHDRVLERHVALHVIAADDVRAPGLLEAARRSATVPDRRLLRVLDADQVDGVCYVVNEWGVGRSLDVILADEGPLAARRAAWIVSEVSASLAAGHDAGVAHGRLVPENVLLDTAGSVRLIGFCVDAALHGLPADRISTDVADLGGLLYCAMTGRWPGVSRSQVPPAPQEHGRVLRPRQVRAGVPRTLDLLCDEVVNPYVGSNGQHVRDGHDLTTARGIGEFLRSFVGDPAGLAEAEAAGHGSHDTGTLVLPRGAVSGASRGGAGAEATQVLRAEQTDPPVDPADDPDDDERSGDDLGEAAGSAAAELPTQAGLPIFDDDSDDVSWLTAGPVKPPPPPPFEEPPERPLCAPEPADGGPARGARPGAAAPTGGHDFWPWDTGTGNGTGTGLPPVEAEEDDEVPGRSWFRLALGILAALVLLVAIVVAFNLGRGRSPLGAVPSEKGSSSPSSPSPTTPITGLTADDFDPQGDPPEENPDLAPLTVDGDPATAWRTMTYDQDLGPGGLKTGVGLVVDLGATHDVASVDLTMVGSPTSVSLYLTDRAPTGVRDLTPAARATVGTRKRITLPDGSSGRYLTVWLTSLPQTDGGFRGEIAEVAVRG